MLCRLPFLLLLFLLTSCARYSDIQDVTLKGGLIESQKELQPRLVFEAPPSFRQEVEWAKVSSPDSSFQLEAQLDLKKADSVQLTALVENYEPLRTRGIVRGQEVQFPPLRFQKFEVPTAKRSRASREKRLRKRVPRTLNTSSSESPVTSMDLLRRSRVGENVNPELLTDQPVEE